VRERELRGLTNRTLNDITRCELCGSRENVERHRIVPGREGGKYNRRNVIRLCREHHALADAGVFTRGAMRAIVEARNGRNGRPSKDELYIRVAELCAGRSTCKRRHVGCVLTDVRGEQVALGWNGTARGAKARCYCADSGRVSCVHAEANAVAKKSWAGECVAYLPISPCVPCAALLVNAGCIRAVVGQVYRDEGGLDVLRAAGADVHILDPSPAEPQPD
jgi:dCMP deaminase